MAIEIVVPRLGWSMEEGAFVAWLKKDGEFVRAGEPLFSIEGDKAVQEIESIDSGILSIAPNCPKPGASVHVGKVLGHLLSKDEITPIEQVPAVPERLDSRAAIGFIAATVVVPDKFEPTRTGFPAISPRALRLAAQLGVDWKRVIGSGRTGRIRERDIRAAAQIQREERLFSTSFLVENAPTVLVTGGCGFIGTWVLRELLERGLNTVVLDSSERPDRWPRVLGKRAEQIPLVKGSLLDRGLLARIFEETRVSHIIHLAAMLTPACQVDPWEGCQVNVLGSVSLFEQARKAINPVRGFSYASSVAVFGDDPTGGTAAPAPVTFYGAFKKSVELIAEQYWRHFGLASLGVRPQVAYGPERDTGLTAGASLAARAAALGETYSINYTGRVGYDYVEDVARALVIGALETQPGACTVDLAGEIADVTEIIAAINAAAPESVGKLSASGPVVPTHLRSDTRLISTIYPDWRTTSLIAGMARIVDFYKRRPISPAPSP